MATLPKTKTKQNKTNKKKYIYIKQGLKAHEKIINTTDHLLAIKEIQLTPL